jgi:IS605 OrfB family transposase
MQNKAITHLKLNRTNAGKLAALDRLADEYQRVTQCFVDLLINAQDRVPNKYADLPVLPTQLSARWQRCAWQQACGLVQSWFSNERRNRPVLRNLCIQANANVVVLERSQTPTFDFWLRISTLDKGCPVRVPIKLYDNARHILAQYEKLCSGVTLNKRGGQWYATLVVERHNQKTKAKGVIGADIGMKAVVTTSDGKCYGEFSAQVQARLIKTAAKRTRKQKLNACLKKKSLPTVNLHDHRAEAYARNGIGQALNQMVVELPKDCAVALEKLNVQDMRFKSRQMNRLLKAHQLGFIRDRLKFKLDERGIRYRSVQPAYSSQQCSHCGFTFALNRRTQATFDCLWCGFQCHADVNAARNIAERFGDGALNALPFRQVEALLAVRFMQRFPDTRSVSAGRETLTTVVWDSTQVVHPPGQAPPLR